MNGERSVHLSFDRELNAFGKGTPQETKIDCVGRFLQIEYVQLAGVITLSFRVLSHLKLGSLPVSIRPILLIDR